MHVGLNLIYVVPPATGGLETYARELLPALCRAAPGVRFTAFVCRAAEAAFADSGARVWALPVMPRRRFGWVPGELTRLPRMAERAQCDLLHSLASTGPAHGRFRRVTTIHDLTYRVLPYEHRGPRYWSARWLVTRGLVPLAARRSDRVIAPSEAARRDVVRYLGIATDRIDVIPEGPGRLAAARSGGSEDEIRRRYALGTRQIVLSVAAAWPHKNLERLVEAMALIPAAERPLLVLAGAPTRYAPRLQRAVRRAGLSESVRSVGWVPQEELERLYRVADCVVCASLNEGFGLPVLEAMARGVPVACSDIGALLEVSGDAALTFDPRSPDHMAQVIGGVLKDPATADRLRVLGRQRAARFSWESTARATLRSYDRALGQTGRRVGG